MLMICMCLRKVDMYVEYFDLRIDKILPESLTKMFQIHKTTFILDAEALKHHDLV